MDTKRRLRNDLVRKLMRLSAEKLTEVNDLLGMIESRLSSKDKTLKLAGSWKDIDDDFFSDMTEDLHTNRAADRSIS